MDPRTSFYWPLCDALQGASSELSALDPLLALSHGNCVPTQWSRGRLRQPEDQVGRSENVGSDGEQQTVILL